MDIGSTYTKAAAIDVSSREVLSTASVNTTSEDISVGLRLAMERAGGGQQFDLRLGCSSAAGGLRVVAVGLVPELTVEAARRAALGAGARILASYGFELTAGELSEILDLNPDMILLAGGTDGGNRNTIIGNAQRLANAGLRLPVVLAGNKAAADEVHEILAAAGIECRITGNVMPRLYELDVEPVRRTIRDLFLERIVRARGLNLAADLLDGPLVPTPVAVLSACRILARRTEVELMAVDVGGATTDVYSIGEGKPAAGVQVRGLREPYDKRTVEGDLGVRVSAESLADVAGLEELATRARVDVKSIQSWVRDISGHPGLLPNTEDQRRMDTALAAAAVEHAVLRHVGRIEQVQTPSGPTLFQYGKDLTGVNLVVGTGGPLATADDPGYLLQRTVGTVPAVLCPRSPGFLVDRDYIMAKAGLLVEYDAEAAADILVRSLQPVKGES